MKVTADSLTFAKMFSVYFKWMRCIRIRKKHAWFLYGKPFCPAAYVWLPISPNIGCGPRFYSIYCNNFRWEGEDDFEKSKHIWKKGNMSWNQLGLGGWGGYGGGLRLFSRTLQRRTEYEPDRVTQTPKNFGRSNFWKVSHWSGWSKIFWPEKNLLVSSRNAELWICKDSAAPMPSKYQTERNTQSVKFQKFDRAPSVQLDKIEKADTGNPACP